MLSRKSVMAEYMVISVIDGEQCASFYDTYAEAKGAKMNSECGLGAYAEIYSREPDDFGTSEYVLIEA